MSNTHAQESQNENQHKTRANNHADIAHDQASDRQFPPLQVGSWIRHPVQCQMSADDRRNSWQKQTSHQSQDSTNQTRDRQRRRRWWRRIRELPTRWRIGRVLRNPKRRRWWRPNPTSRRDPDGRAQFGNTRGRCPVTHPFPPHQLGCGNFPGSKLDPQLSIGHGAMLRGVLRVIPFHGFRH